MKGKAAQACPTLCDPMDYTVPEILQARILEWVVIPFSCGSSQPRDQTQVSHIAGTILYRLSHQGSPRILEWVAFPFSPGSSWPRNRIGVSWIAGRFFIIYHGSPLSHKKEWNLAICDNMDGPRGYYAKWNKSDRETQIPYDFAYTWDLKKTTTNELI